MEKAKTQKVCKYCGSESVAVDALAEWDVDTQQWELSATFDNSFCRDCDGETIIVDKPA